MKIPFLMGNGISEDKSPILLAAPHRGGLVRLMVAPERRLELMRESAELPSLQISASSSANLAMLASGAFSPLDRFVGKREYESIMASMRLTTGELCPMPITLPAGDLSSVDTGARIALRDLQNRPLAIMMVDEVFEIPHVRSSRKPTLFDAGRDSDFADPLALSGSLEVFNIPADIQLPDMWKDPAMIREQLALLGRDHVIAVDAWDSRDGKQTEWLRRLAEERRASLLFNLAASEPRVDAFDHFHYLLACKAAFSRFFSSSQAFLNFVHLSSNISSENRVLWHAMVHRNYGAGTYVIDQTRCSNMDRASSSRAGVSTPSQNLLNCAEELGVELILRQTSQTERKFSAGRSGSSSVAPRHGASSAPPKNVPLPRAVLRVPSDWGLCLWFTGLPSAGKSAIAEDLLVMLMESGLRVTLLDGDTVRTHLSKGLGFSREDRNTNVQRIGFVAAEIVRHRGVVLCAAVSPYRETRDAVREMMPEGSFVEIFVDTPVEECERRDVKGFYAKARAGQLSHFTGIDDPYEPPQHPEVVLRTQKTTVRANALQLMRFLTNEQYLNPSTEQDNSWPALQAAGNSARAGR
jgi:sulfate adenylyltransferase